MRLTFLAAIQNNHFTTWPGLDKKLITKNLDDNVHTIKGHLKQEKQNLQPTQNKNKLRTVQAKFIQLKATNPSATFKELLENDIHTDFFPTSDSPNQRTNCIFYTAVESSPTGLGYVDTTGRFPYRSARQNEYIYVGYNYNANSISAVAIRDR